MTSCRTCNTALLGDETTLCGPCQGAEEEPIEVMIRKMAERTVETEPKRDADLRGWATSEIKAMLSKSDLLILRTVRRHRFAMTGHRTDFDAGLVYGRSAHALVRRDLLRVTESGPSWVVVALTDFGRAVLDAR